MKWHLVFEDNEKSPLSELLLAYIQNEFSCKLHFSNGAGNLSDKIHKILNH